MNRLKTKKLVLSAMFLAVCLLLPFLTGQMQQFGNMLLPMHLPVLLCGFICGWPWGLAVGFAAPLLRSALFGMPVMFPAALSMAFELGTYGLATGLLYNCLPKHRFSIFIALISAMICGRVVWGIVRIFISFSQTETFTWAMFVSGAVTTAVPGIVIQLIFVPLIIYALTKNGHIPLKSESDRN